MGVDLPVARFLAGESRRGVSFARLLTLGHQGYYLDAAEYAALAADLGLSAQQPEYADELFEILGAAAVDIMDVSTYEGANVLHDLNQPVDPARHGQYDCVFDGGALEHVFNFPGALKNCLEMVKPGGHFLAATPASGLCGHGFYQFSPELYFSALSAANGYRLERLFFYERGRWYAARPPEETGRRIELSLGRPTLMYLAARRFEEKEIFRAWPQQSNYVSAWEPAGPAAAPRPPLRLKALLLRLPGLARLRDHWREWRRRRGTSLRNTDWFTPIDLD